MNPYWSYLLTAVGVFGLWLAGRKDRRGWMVGIGAQVLWIAYATATHQWGFYVSALAYGFVYAKNAYAWKPKPEPSWPVNASLWHPVCRYCGADCSEGRSWDGGDLYACPSCAEKRSSPRTAGHRRARVNGTLCTAPGCTHPDHRSGS